MRRKLFGLMTMLALVSLIAGCQQIKEGFNEATQAIDEELEQDRKLREQRMAEKKAAEEKAATDGAASDSGSGGSGSTEPAPGGAPADGGDTAATPMGAPVTVTIDGKGEKGDATGNYWDVQGKVSAAPVAKFEIDKSMGEFQMCILNIYTGTDTDNLEEKGAYAVTDFASEDKTLAPGREFNLGAPPASVTILSPAGARVEKIPFESGKTYLVYFVVNGSAESTTHITRFTVE